MRVVFGEIPILADTDLAILKFEQMSRRQLVNAGECRDGLGHIAEVKIFQQRLRIDFGQLGSNRQNRFDLRSEVEISLVQRVMQRLLA